MIEIVYKEEKKEAKGNEGIFRLPRNIRQIGEGKSYLKIYMEDYVYTYLQRIAREEPVKGRGSILLGKYKWDAGISYVFIQSALKVEEMEPAREHITLDEQVWTGIHDKMKEYFPEQEVVGWSLFLPGSGMEISDAILHTHLDHFGGNDKVFFYYQPQEKEEAFYTYENGQLVSQGGYYIYYEKNEPMQSYMIGQNNRSIEDENQVPDRAVNHFRKTILDKAKNGQGFRARGMVYGVSACSVLAALALGITFVNHYDGMKNAVGTVLEEKKEVLENKSVGAGAQGRKEAGETEDAETQGRKEAGETEDAEAQGRKEAGETEGTEAGETENGGASPSQKPGQKQQEDQKPGAEKSQGTKESQAARENQEAAWQKESQAGENASKTSEGEGKETADTEEGKKASSQAGKKYLVKRGDTISQISAAYYGSVSMVEEICRMNHISRNDIIYEGQLLLLP